MSIGIRVSTSKDKLEAYLCLTEPEGNEGWYTEKDMFDSLKEGGIVFGIDEGIVDALALSPRYGENVVVARGTPPKKGDDGYIEHYIEENPEVKPTVKPDGTVDYKDMNVVHSVEKDQKLCEVLPPKPGTDGMDVLGNEITAQSGKAISVPRGKGVKLTEDGKFVVASLGGQARRSGNSLEVKPVFEVQENVDNSTGNIKFVGNVIVRGGVTSGFSIHAGGNVEVFGRVEKANITAVGDIVLHSGVGGMGAGMIKSGGRIYAKYVENCTLSAHGKITAEAIMHSTVRCGDVVELTGRKGLIVGGSVKASHMVKAVTIGSQFSTPTEIEVGNDPKSKDRLKELKEMLDANEAEEKKTRQACELLTKLDRTGNLTNEKRLMLNRTGRMNEKHKEKIVGLKEEIEKLEASLEKGNRGVVKASNYIYHGVKISIGNASMVVKEELAHCSLKREGADVKLAAY